ncbi:MAG: GNAT family N-acetyltransferase [Tumebacillaceae bacterium]
MGKEQVTVELVRVPLEELPVLENLSRYYVYEFSQYIPQIKVHADGQFGALNGLETYWTEPQKHPFFLYADGELAGFALVSSATAEEPNNMDEFYVLRKFEGRGIGKKAAMQLFDRFPGKWTVTQIQKNYPAQAFWRSVIMAYTNNQHTERYDEQRRSIQEFTSPAQSN